MSYQKPEVVVLDSPLRAIQGNCKGTQTNPDAHFSANDATAAAYEADE